MISFILNKSTRQVRANKCLLGAKPVMVTVSIPDIQLITPDEIITINTHDIPGNEEVPKKEKLS